MTPLERSARWWHNCHGANPPLSDWISGLLHKFQSMPGPSMNRRIRYEIPLLALELLATVSSWERENQSS